MVHFIPPSHRRLAMLAAQADSAPALICGASGTGKGAIARWIHSNSPRSTRPLISAELGKSLASQIPLAQSGTLVIPEIGEWPFSEQKVLSSFLKNKTIANPDGSGTRMLLNVRIISTTSQGLDGRAQGGLFNIELLERLNVFRIEMPPLSRRLDELEDIAMVIVGEITREVHKEHLRGLSEDAVEKLRDYEWPGNIRELRNVLRLAVLAAKGDRIGAGDLPSFGYDRVDFRATREHFEKVYISELLKTFNWEVDTTCRMTRMDKTALLAKIREYGIKPGSETVPAPSP